MIRVSDRTIHLMSHEKARESKIGTVVIARVLPSGWYLRTVSRKTKVSPYHYDEVRATLAEVLKALPKKQHERVLALHDAVVEDEAWRIDRASSRLEKMRVERKAVA